jgi:hypothetical protein
MEAAPKEEWISETQANRQKDRRLAKSNQREIEWLCC